MRFLGIGLVLGSVGLVAFEGCGPAATSTGTGSTSASSTQSSSTSSSTSGGSSSGSGTGGYCFTASTGVGSGYTAVALACGQDTPSGLAVSNGVVYWTNYDGAASGGNNSTGAGGAIMSVPTAGGTPTTVVPNQDFPWAIAADSNNIYWTNYDNGTANSGGGSTTSGTVVQASLSGANVTTLQTDLEDPYGIAVDSTNVYFTTYGGGRVKKVPIGGGAVVTLAQGLNGPCYIAVSGGNVYWTNYGDGTVDTIPTSGTGPTAPTVLATDAAMASANGIGVSGSNVFYAASNNPGAIWSVPAAGGTQTAIANMQATPWGLAVDSTNVYWTTDDAPGSLVSVPQAGGTTTTLATYFEYPTAIAVDSTGVYTAGEGGHIWRVTAE